MIPVRNLFIGAIIKAVVSYSLIGIHAININGAPIGTVIAYITAGILNYIALKKYADVEVDAGNVLMKPLIAAIIMGIATIAVYKLVFLATGSNLLGVFISMAAAVLVYFVTIFKTRTITREEMKLIPKGDLIYNFAVKMKIAE